MTPDAFLDEDNWAGSYYELAIQLGHRGDDHADERLIGALRAIWRHPTLLGCYLNRLADPARQHRLTPADLDLPDSTHVYGWANPPGRPALVCVTSVIREDFGPGDDWLNLGLPTGALERLESDLIYPIHANDQNRVWREPLDTWLAAIASDVARAVGFRAALIGEEVSGLPVADMLTSAPRSCSVVMPTRNGVIHYPPTTW
jgi:hypothetical protein